MVRDFVAFMRCWAIWRNLKGSGPVQIVIGRMKGFGVTIDIVGSVRRESE